MVAILTVVAILTIIYLSFKKKESKVALWLAVLGVLVIIFLIFSTTFYFYENSEMEIARNSDLSEKDSDSSKKDSPLINSKYFHWNNIDLLEQGDIEIIAYINGEAYEGDNYLGEGSFYLPKALKGKKCIVVFKNENQEERISTKVGTALRLPKQLIALNPNDYFPRSKDDLGKLVHSIPDTMELKKWTTINRLVAVRIREMSSFRAKSKHGEFFIPQEQPRVAGDHRNGRAPVHDFVAAF